MSYQYKDNKLPKTAYQKRIFAGITDATTLILKHINYPLNKKRNIISCLQGAANSRTQFRLTNLTLARRMEHTGKDGTAKQAAYREVKALKEFQFESGLLLFDVIQGGGLDYTPNEYIDHITEVSVWLYNQAIDEKQTTRSKDPLSKIMLKFLDEAVSKLPSLKDSHLEKTYIRKKARQLKLTSETNREDKLKKELLHFVRNFKFSGDSLVEDTERLSVELVNVAKLFFGAMKNTEEEKKAELTNEKVSPMSCPPISFLHDNNGDTPLQICSPSQNRSLLQTALEYADMGYKIIPLHTPDNLTKCSCSKKEKCHSPGKHPRTARGVNDATTDLKTINSWWERWENANIGIATGKESNLICLDVDPRHGGDKSLSDLFDKHQQIPDTFTVKTGGDGIHFYFKYSDKITKNSAGLLGEGLDIKTNGGYIVAPPSIHYTGGIYEVTRRTQLSEMPGWMQDLLIQNKEIEQTGDVKSSTTKMTSLTNNGSIPNGTRNKKLFNVACAMFGKGKDCESVKLEINDINANKCSPPLEQSEVDRIIQNAFKYEQ